MYKWPCLQLSSTILAATHRQPRLSSMTFEQAVKHFLGYCQLVKTWKHTPQHASTHQTLWSLAGFWNGDGFSSSEHIFHALISALGQIGWRIQCSTFPWWFYLKDMVFSLSCAICCLKFHPFQPGGSRALIGHVFEGTLAPRGWTALGEPDKVGV